MQTSEQTSNATAQAAWNKRPLIISGPCSAETEEQVIATAQRLAATGKIDMLRAGIWKPRTKPGGFEGNGVPENSDGIVELAFVLQDGPQIG